MQSIIRKNLQNLIHGIIKVEMLPEALKCISVGSRAFVRAVRAFQEAYGLLVDGELGPITMKEIEKQSKRASGKSKTTQRKTQKATKDVAIDVDSEE